MAFLIKDLTATLNLTLVPQDDPQNQAWMMVIGCNPGSAQACVTGTTRPTKVYGQGLADQANLDLLQTALRDVLANFPAISQEIKEAAKEQLGQG